MKKDISTLAALLIASAAFVACSSDDDSIIEDQQPATTGTYTMTIEASKGDAATTRALTLSNKTLNATWAQGEAVTVYNVTRSADLTGTLTAQSSGATTVLKGTLTGTIQNGDELKLKFLSPDYDTQDGTLTYIATHCDYAEATVTVTDASAPSVTTTDASFVNQQAIVKFTLKDDPNSVFNATQLTISDGSNTYTVTPASATSELFVALPSITSQTVTLTATDGTNNVKYVKGGVSFANGQYYEIGVQMTYLISTLDQWNGFAAKVNVDGHAAIRAKQTANISGVTTVVGNSESNPFRGSYNGQGYTISNVNINNSEGTNPTGLFGTVNSASSVIENVVVASGTVSSTGQNVGAVVGELNSGTVQYCANHAEVTTSYTSDKNRLGGVVGWMSSSGGDNNRIEHCINYGYVHGKSYVGGVVGCFGGGFVTSCQNYGTVQLSGASGAGIVGWNTSKDYTKIQSNHSAGPIKVGSKSQYQGKTACYIICSNSLLASHVYYPNNTYLYTMTITIGSTDYTDYTGNDLATFEPAAQAVDSNPAGITIGGTTYSSPAPQN